MKKTLMTLAIVAMTTVAFSAQAQQVKARATVEPVQACPATEVCDAECTVAECADGQCGPCIFFEGITLTPDQQTRLAALKPAKKECKGDKKECTAEKKECKGEKANCDKPRRRGHQQCDKKAYIAQVKEILTPDQYVIFLENVATKAPAEKLHKAGKRAAERGGARRAAKTCDKAPKACDKAAKTCEKAAKACEKAPAAAK